MRPEWKWSTLPWQAAVAAVFFTLCGVVMLPQLLVLALTNPGRFRGENKLTLSELVGLWAQADPAAVTGAPIPGWLHWVMLIAVILLAVLAVTLLLLVASRRRKDPQRKEGLAPLKDVRRELSEQQLVEVRGPKLRPRIPARDLTASDCGYRVGAFPCVSGLGESTGS